jgi:peptidoglycan/LPS O-acetylase OafA/YrhL
VRWLQVVVPALLVAMLVLALLWQPPQAQVFWGSDLRHVPRFMALFLAGACLALWQPRLPAKAPWVALLVLALAYAAVPAPELRLSLLLLMLPLAAVLLGGLRLPPERVLRNDVSYGVYLYAFPVQQAVIAVAAPLGLWPTMLLAAAITVGLASLSWWAVERPALRLKPARREAAAR